MRLKNMEINDEYDSTLYSDLQVVVKRVTALLPRELDYNETHYQKVLARELKLCDRFKNFEISTEVNIPYTLHDGFTFGFGRADIILENRALQECIILELKASVSTQWKNMQKFASQVNKYVHHHQTSSRKKGIVIIFNPSFQKKLASVITIQ